MDTPPGGGEGVVPGVVPPVPGTPIPGRLPPGNPVPGIVTPGIPMPGIVPPTPGTGMPVAGLIVGVVGIVPTPPGKPVGNVAPPPPGRVLPEPAAPGIGTAPPAAPGTGVMGAPGIPPPAGTPAWESIRCNPPRKPTLNSARVTRFNCFLGFIVAMSMGLLNPTSHFFQVETRFHCAFSCSLGAFMGPTGSTHSALDEPENLRALQHITFQPIAIRHNRHRPIGAADRSAAVRAFYQ